MTTSKITTPEELLTLQVEEFNKGNIEFLMTLYENDACFASKLGRFDRNLQGIRQAFQNLIDTGCKLDANIKRILRASDLVLLITEWSINGTNLMINPLVLPVEVLSIPTPGGSLEKNAKSLWDSLFNGGKAGDLKISLDQD